MESCKVIDLLNKIAKGEEVPKNIIIRNNIYMLKDDRDLYNINFTYEDMYENYWLDNAELNEKIEIIEEEKEIEELNLDTDELLKNVIITAQDYVIEGKINELVREINKLKKEGKRND